MKHKRSLSLVLGITGALLLLAVVGLVLAAPVTIDTFDDSTTYVGDTVSANPLDKIVSDTYDIGSVIGGERDLYVEHTSGTGPVSVNVDSYNSNQLKFDQGSGVLGRGSVVWDGNDNDGDSLDTTGLGGKDLTDSGTNNGIQLLVYEGDGAFDLGIYVYSDTNTVYYTLTISSDVEPPGTSFFIPFTDFTGSQSVFSDAGAVEFRIVPTAAAVDLTVDLFEATANTDWGDLPDTYSTTLASNGARHTLSGTLYLGSQIDLEADGVPSTGADGDDNANFSDEDGIVEAGTNAGGNPGWKNGTNGGAVTVTVGGGAGCLSAWLDWGENGKFDVANEHIIDKQAVSVGDTLITFDVPAGTFTGTTGTRDFYARFRLYPDTGTAGCSDETIDYYGSVTGGEVEDYLWEYDKPTAVTLSSLNAHSGVALPTAFVLIAATLAGGAGLFVLSRRRKA